MAKSKTRGRPANPGCALQLEAGLRQAGSDGRVCHVVDLLDEAYRAKG